MKVEKFNLQQTDTHTKASAQITWEDNARTPGEVYFEVENRFSDYLQCNPDAFLLACTLPALHFHEKRIAISEAVCPELKTCMETAVKWLISWYYPDIESFSIECKARDYASNVSKKERAGFFFSGGIDSYATLGANHTGFPKDHPWYIKDGIVVYGLELDTHDSFDYVLKLLSDAADGIGINLIPVYTNIYLQYREEDALDNYDFWIKKYMGAALASVAHILSEKLSVVSIAAAHSIPDAAAPHGANPLLVNNYSSMDMRIRIDGISSTRFAKTALVSENTAYLNHLRVCNRFNLYSKNSLNCGACEKCVRTMMALLALKKLDITDAFPSHDVTVEQLKRSIKLNPTVLEYYQELIGPLKDCGRTDLSSEITRCYERFRRPEWKKNIIQQISRIDEKFLRNRLRKIRRNLFE